MHKEITLTMDSILTYEQVLDLEISIILRNDPTFTILRLHGDIEEKTFEKLCYALRRNTHLTVIKFQNVYLDHWNIQDLTTALYENKSLQELSFSDSSLTTLSFKYLMKWLQTSKNTIQELNIDGNNYINSAGMHFIVEMLQVNTQLQKFWIELTSLHNREMQLLAKCLQKQTFLTELYVSCTQTTVFTQQTIEEMANILRYNSTLTVIYFGIDTLTYKKQRILDDALRDYNGSLLDFEPSSDRTKIYLRRNKLAQEECRKAVLTLLNLAKYTVQNPYDLKELESEFPYETNRNVMFLMAKQLWNTRHQSIWWDLVDWEHVQDDVCSIMSPCAYCFADQARFQENSTVGMPFCGTYCQWMHHVGVPLGLPDLRGKTPQQVEALCAGHFEDYE